MLVGNCRTKNCDDWTIYGTTRRPTESDYKNK